MWRYPDRSSSLDFLCRRWCGLLAFAITALLMRAPVGADEYRVAKATDGPPKAQLGKAVAGRLSPTGVTLIRGTNRPLCKIWLCRDLPSIKSSSPSGYALQDGALIGVVQYEHTGGDFRNQEIPKGVYTIRYARIPTDGAHEGVSPTADFLLLVAAKEDQNADPILPGDLAIMSGDSIGSLHPAILSLKAPKGNDAPVIRHDEEHDWWLLQLKGQSKTGDKTKDVPLCFVVAGHIEE